MPRPAYRQTALVRRLVKPLVFGLALLPTAYLLYGLWSASLGANPAETIQLQTGRWAFKFLLLTLAITPLRRLTGWNVVIQYRRMLGLFAFYYASLHFASYLVLDQYFDWRAMLADIGKRPFITMGFTAFVLMVPLALTSTKGWIRRLGGRRWQSIHRLIYVSAVCARDSFPLEGESGPWRRGPVRRYRAGVAGVPRGFLAQESVSSAGSTGSSPPKSASSLKVPVF